MNFARFCVAIDPEFRLLDADAVDARSQTGPAKAIEREAQALAALRQTWHTLNHRLFHGSLRPPVLRLSDRVDQLGSWRVSSREICVQRHFLMQHPWAEVAELLKHEMAHQYLSEVLKVQGEPAHGPTFQAVCRDRGIDARRNGAFVLPEATQKVVNRIQKLLALAESSSQHEAEAAAAQAQRLMLKHNLKALEQPNSEYSFRQLGAPRGRIYEHSRRLAAILSQHYFVDVIWVGAYDAERGVEGRVLEISGRPENLDMAAYVYDFLLASAESLWRQHQRLEGTQGRERRRFLAGVLSGFQSKLRQQSQAQAEKGLVWVEDAKLTAWMHRRYPRRVTRRHQGERISASYRKGVLAGRELVLKRPVEAKAKRREGGQGPLKQLKG